MSRLGLVLLVAALAGCEGIQSALAPAGPIAREISVLWWWMLGAAAVIFALVLVLLLYSVFGRQERPGRVQTRRLVYLGGIALPVVLLSILMPLGVQVGAGVTSPSSPETLRIRVTGHQWWWGVEYDFDAPFTRFETANEIYLPIGEPVEILLTSADVVHSFWVPKLAGKLDLLPGRENRMMLVADKEGVFRGECAEFCGVSHTMMALHVVAVPPAEFDAWAERQLEPAAPPDESLISRGAALFKATGCLVCHTVRGHGAWGQQGPDLTNVGARLTIGAGALLNTRENIALWMARNDDVKPGNKMPEFDDLPLDTRLAIAAYLESLE